MATEEITQFIGKSGSSRIFEVEKGAIRRFSDAVGDLNPLYRDEEYARDSRYGSIIAPPGFFGWPLKHPADTVLLVDSIPELRIAMENAGFNQLLDGGMDYEFFLPVRSGDTLVGTPVVANIRERKGSSGTLVLAWVETTYVNQNGDKVAVSRETLIFR